MEAPRGGNGWEAWGNHVLKELERLDECNTEQQKMITALQVEQGMLKTKSGIWGGIAGLIPSLGLLVYYIVKNAK